MRYAVFLRGMNLGKRRITNADLVACFEALGLAEVEAFLASGNVVFEARGGVAAIAKRVERGLREALHYEVPTFVRNGRQVAAIAAAAPFAGRDGAKRGGKVQVALLRAAPPTGVARALSEHETRDDWLTLQGSELYWWPSLGVGKSELDMRVLEKLLGPMTVRTQSTIQRMAGKFFP